MSVEHYTITPSPIATSGGVAAVTGVGQRSLFTVAGGPWLIGDRLTLLFTQVESGLQSQFGAGNVTGVQPTFCFTFNDKMYLLAGSTVYFSALGSPTVFNDPNATGGGYVILTNKFATPENLVAMASFQGRLVFLSRQTIQIWTAPADPAAWQLNQIFDSIGTRSPLSVKTKGDLEVFFLDETGIRSLRVRDNTLNAYPEDLGSPIDEIVQAKLAASSDAQKDAACGIFEPASKRYWLFLKDTIYVLSEFPTAKIEAWSKYLPTYDAGATLTISGGPTGTITLTAPGSVVIANAVAWTVNASGTATALATAINLGTGTHGYTASAVGAVVTLVPPSTVHGVSNTLIVTLSGGANIVVTVAAKQVAFTPTKFVTWKGQVYCRAGNSIFLYGGTDNATYDDCVATMETPWLDAKTPATRKLCKGLDVAMSGAWVLSAGMDPESGTLDQVFSGTTQSFDKGRIPYSSQGTHFKLKAVTAGSTAAKLSSLIFKYDLADEE